MHGFRIRPHTIRARDIKRFVDGYEKSILTTINIGVANTRQPPPCPHLYKYLCLLNCDILHNFGVHNNSRVFSYSNIFLHFGMPLSCGRAIGLCSEQYNASIDRGGEQTGAPPKISSTLENSTKFRIFGIAQRAESERKLRIYGFALPIGVSRFDVIFLEHFFFFGFTSVVVNKVRTIFWQFRIALSRSGSRETSENS